MKRTWAALVFALAAVAANARTAIDGALPHEAEVYGALLPEFKFGAKTPPMLLLHGDDDHYSSMGSVRIYEEPHRRKLPAQMTIYSGATDGLNDRVNVRDWRKSIFDWMSSRRFRGL